jgi:hypothetical protein
MRAAEATSKELLAALLRRPFDLCAMGRHGFIAFLLVTTLANSSPSGEPWMGRVKWIKKAAAEFLFVQPVEEVDGWGD